MVDPNRYTKRYDFLRHIRMNLMSRTLQVYCLFYLFYDREPVFNQICSTKSSN